MKKFKFRLRAVLKEREIREDQRKREFASAADVFRREKEKLEKYENIRKTNVSALTAEKMRSDPDISLMRVCESYIFLMTRKISGQQEQVVNAGRMAEQARAALQEAQKRRKVMTLLRDREKTDYFLQLDRQEQKELDEISIFRGKTCLT